MNERLTHRGPDGEGLYEDDRISMAMRRLSIIDITGGGQPLYNEDRSIVLICNGEIYNFIELREELISCGHRFSSKSDCETIIHAYEQYGKAFIHRIRGMFAFCLYDTRTKTVIIARDRLGEKPLYYKLTDTVLAFSSEMKSLIETIPVDGRTLDEESVRAYFHFGYVPEPHTLVRTVQKVPPGHMLICNTESFDTRVEEYWNMSDAPALPAHDQSRRIRDRLEEIQRMIIRSDVPVGISLSGGIDSSIIAVLAARHSPDKLHAFSVGYPDRPDNDERLLAQDLAKKLKLQFHDIEIPTQAMVKDFIAMVHSMDDPIADIAAYGYYAVSRAARHAGVPVLLAGFGGDELFWGYEWARRAAYYNDLKTTFLGKTRLLYLLSKESWRKIVKKPFSSLRRMIDQSYSEKTLVYELTAAWRSTHEQEDRIFTRAFLGRTDDRRALSANAATDVSQPLRVSTLLTKTWLTSNCVDLGDRLSMAHSVELRLPLLDHKLYEDVLGMRKNDPRDYMRGYKHDLIEATKDIIPEEILSRKKRGFSPPSAEWLRAIMEQHGQMLRDGELARRGILRPDHIEKLLTGHRLQSSYIALVLEVWMRAYLPS